MSNEKERIHARMDKRSKATASRYAKRGAARAAAPIGWDELDALAVARLVFAVTNAGDAVLFGRTSEGGALVLTVMSGNDRVKEYYSDAETAQRAIMELTALADA